MAVKNRLLTLSCCPLTLSCCPRRYSNGCQESTPDPFLLTLSCGGFSINTLGPAFGKVDFIGKLRISYKKTSATTIEVGGVEAIGSFDDLYDWAYGGAKFSFIGFTFDPREPAMVQAGHATLSKAPHANAGKVFFTRLEFNAPFVNTWNGTY